MTAATESARRLETALRESLTGDVRFDEMSRGLYSTDASIYQVSPIGIVQPKSMDDVRAAVAIAAAQGVPILARGGGTSLSGQSVTTGLVIDFSRYLNQILEIDVARRLVRVQPGVVLDQLNAALAPHGLQFGPDVATSSRANLGGMIGNNSAGSRSVRMGKVSDHVRELSVLLSDGTHLTCGPLDAAALRAKQALPGREGEIYRRFPALVEEHRRDILAKYPRLLRRVSGYNFDAFVPEIQDQFPRAAAVVELDREWPDRQDFNLSRLVVGAEGTLGIVTEALLHVVPLPRERGVVLIQFRSIDEALTAVPKILKCQPSAVELLDRQFVELARTHPKYKSSLDFVTGLPEALLIIEFSGETAMHVSDGLQYLEQQLQGHPGLERYLPAETREQRDAIWNCRKAGAPLLLSIPGARKPIAFVEDPAVAPEKLAGFTRRFSEILKKYGLVGAYYGHASVGCLHLRPMIDTKSARDLQILKSVSDDVAALVVEFGGAMSGEHGDGLARSYHNLRLFGPKLFQAFGDVKRLFDPAGLLNPGKVTAQPSPIENLRYGTDYHALPIATHLDFSREEEFSEAPGQGFLAAAEMCNGSAVCRKTGTGTMCPSYMVTLDEEHTPRARANAIRLALSGQLPPGALTSPRMHDVFDLCLMCKGCKTECPSNVDVAKLKAEFLAQSHREHGSTWGAWLMAHAAWINRLGSLVAPVANWLNTLPITRWPLEWLTGIDRRRSLPKFHFNTFGRWFDRRAKQADVRPGPLVVFLDDCLTSHCEPHIPRAAVEVLEHAGYQVERANLWCCGRPLMSKGFVDEARGLARRNVEKLSRWLDRGATFVGVEPSCVLTFVDEYPDLVPSETLNRIRERVLLVDQFLAGEAALAKLALKLDSQSSEVLLHGHCQQKALVGTQGTKQLLAGLPGVNVREVDSGCCGMAGSFGYDHFDISQQIGERVLFPAVKSQEGTTVAPGFSCRHQIEEATGILPKHPIELVHERLCGQQSTTR